MALLHLHTRRVRNFVLQLLLVGWLAAMTSMAAVDAQVATPTPTAIAGRTTEYGVIRDPSFTPLPGATADSGYYAGGGYRIEVPSSWNGGLVLFAHGYRGEGPEIFVSDPPIRGHVIGRGYRRWARQAHTHYVASSSTAS